MAYDEFLARRVRAVLAEVRFVQEKRMFGGLVFMVRGMMCVSVGKERIMCRLDPAVHDAVLQHKGCRTVVMRGGPRRGYVYVNAEAIRTKRQLDHWIRLALHYNAQLAGKRQAS